MRRWCNQKQIPCNLFVIASTTSWPEQRDFAINDSSYLNQRDCFFPLVLTETGALSPKDLLSLRAGYPSLLPDTTTGHKCILFDWRNKLPNASTKEILCCLFYVYKVLAENELSQIDGAHVFMVSAMPHSKDPKIELSSSEYFHCCCTLMSQAFPVKVYVTLLSVPQQKRPLVAAKIVDVCVQMLNQYFDTSAKSPRKNCTISIHVQPPRNKTMILNDLLDLGLVQKAIPHFYGGEWKQADFFDWCQERMEWEHKVHEHRLLGDCLGTMASWKRITKNILPDLPPHVIAISHLAPASLVQEPKSMILTRMGTTSCAARRTRENDWRSSVVWSI